MSHDDVHSGSPLPSKRFEGREEFRQLVRDALAAAAHEGWREITAFHDAVLTNARLTFNVLISRDPETARVDLGRRKIVGRADFQIGGHQSARVAADRLAQVLYQRTQSDNRADADGDAQKKEQQTPPRRANFTKR